MCSLLVALPLAVLGCGSSEGSSEPVGDPEEQDSGDETTSTGGADDEVDTAAFCEGVEVFEGLDTEDSGTIAPEVLDDFDELAADAPDEVADELATLAELFRTLSETDLDDEEAFAEVMGLLLDPEVVEASETVEAYVLEECDVDIDPDDSDDLDAGDLEEGDLELGEDVDSGDLDDGVSIEAFEEFLDEGGDAAHPWRDDLVGTSISVTNGAVDVTLDFPVGVEVDDAVAACVAADDHFGPLADELAITVTIDGSDAATYDPGTGCAPVA